jgi:predicted dehydrogenase
LIILIIGLGSIGKRHVQAISKVRPDAIIYALRSKPHSPQLKGIINVYDFCEVDKKVDFVIISNPTVFHADTILKCLNLSCPLFIEKPVVSDLINSEFIVDEIGKTVTYIGCNMRFHPAIKYFKSNIIDKLSKINEINIYAGSYLPDWRPGRDFREIYSSNSELGGGVHLDLIHELDYCLWLFGKPKKSQCINRSRSSLNISAIDYTQYILEYPDFIADIKLNYFRRDPKRMIEILTSDDTIVVDLITCSIYSSFTGKIYFEDKNFNIADTYVEQMSYFMNCITGLEKSMNTFKDGIETLKIALDEKA